MFKAQIIMFTAIKAYGAHVDELTAYIPTPALHW